MIAGLRETGGAARAHIQCAPTAGNWDRGCRGGLNIRPGRVAIIAGLRETIGAARAHIQCAPTAGNWDRGCRGGLHIRPGRVAMIAGLRETGGAARAHIQCAPTGDFLGKIDPVPTFLGCSGYIPGIAQGSFSFGLHGHRRSAAKGDPDTVEISPGGHRGYSRWW